MTKRENANTVAVSLVERSWNLASQGRKENPCDQVSSWFALISLFYLTFVRQAKQVFTTQPNWTPLMKEVRLVDQGDFQQVSPTVTTHDDESLSSFFFCS